MANAEHLKILKSGVEEWNKWREENKGVRPDLSRADLSSANLFGANLSHTNLRGANLTNVYLGRANMLWAELHDAELLNANLTYAHMLAANLTRANLTAANLFRTDLDRADLIYADLSSAQISSAYMSFADLSNAKLTGAKLNGSDLSNANMSNAELTDADLSWTILAWANLFNANFSGTQIGHTVFGITDLSTCKSLETIIVHGPCSIDFQTLRASKNLPKEFLTKIGIPELLMEYLPEFYNPALRIYPVFLSHSWADKQFVHKLYEALIQKGVTVWLDEKKMKLGDNIHDSIADAIKYYDKLILVCSENALNSWWVEKELERVYEKERQLQKQHGKKFRLVIPIMIDDKILSTEGGIFDTLRNSKIGDFTGWQDSDKFEKALEELVDALNANRLEIKPPTYL